MSTPPDTITGGRAVVDALLAAGVDHAFCVPGESFMGVLDALHDEPRIRLIATRHEGGAALMAAAFGRIAYRPAVCMGTRMVGAANMGIGIHAARQDSAPLIALFGQVARTERHREAFQEVDLSHAFAPVAKWTVEPPSAARLGELTMRAAREAISGRPGPVTIALCEDILGEQVAAHDFRPIARPKPAPDPAAIAQTLALLRRAERPLLVLGGGVLAAGATELYVQLAEDLGIPVMASWRRPDVFPNDHPQFIGQTGLWAPPWVLERQLEADVLLAVGTRLAEASTHDYKVPGPNTKLIHVDIAAETLGGHRVNAELICMSDALLFGRALADALRAAPIPAERRDAWARRTAQDRETIERITTPARRGAARGGYVDQQAVAWHLRRVLPREAIITADSGNFGGWPHRLLRWNHPETFLAPMSGAMGYGIPAGIAAKLARPERSVVTFVGDGGFLMTGAELETAVREKVPTVTLVCDNQQYGTIRMWQERQHPGRPVATALGAVDFAGVADKLGALGIAVRDEAEFPGAFDEALRAGRPAVLHLRVDPQVVSVGSDVAAAH